MLIEFPVLFNTVLKQDILVLDVTLLIGVMIVIKLIDGEWMHDVRKQLHDMYPILIALVGLLALTALKP